MIQRRLTITLAAILVVVVSGLVWYSRHRVRELDVVITQSRIDSVLARKFPREKTLLKVLTLTLEHPMATPVPGTDKVRIGMDARARIGIAGLGREYNGGATILTRVRYRREDKTFCLCDAVFERLDLPKVPQKHQLTLMDAASLLSSEIFHELPVYTLSGKDTKQNLARWLLKDVVVADDAVHAKFGL